MSETLSYIILSEEEGFSQIDSMVSFGSEIQLTLKVLGVHDNVIERVECRKG